MDAMKIPIAEQFSYVVGLKHYSYGDIAEAIKVGDKIVLVAEPENKFDKLAVAVYYYKPEGPTVKIGYISKWENALVAHALAGGKLVRAEVEIHDMRRDLEDRLQLHITVDHVDAH
jgi:hypothetical protein